MRSRKIICTTILMMTIALSGCSMNDGSKEGSAGPNKNTDGSSDFETLEYETEESSKEEEVTMHVQAITPVKNPMDHNPLMTQSYSADPYGIVYEGRVYLYMTGDRTMYEADGSIRKNNYSNIDTIHVISSDDLVNWTDHGEIAAAGVNGEAKWGNNSWAPAACWKVIDGRPKFFLYFANSGNGIAVLTSDSPVGPFVDPIGEALVSRNTPTCNEVTWLFDPAVLVDDDGHGYLYFGGGIPSPDKASNPGTARVAKLADDMIHLDGDPIAIENVEYLFEDSGINKIGDKYIYSYCSNFDVPNEYVTTGGFGRGEIITMAGDSPMGPFTKVGSILKNPEYFFTYGGNNHHCMFEYEGNWYVTYHASLIEEKAGANNGYRSVNLDKIEITEDGVFAVAKGTKAGVDQVKNFNPFADSSFTTMSNQAGIQIVNGVNDTNIITGAPMSLKIVEDGAFTQITGADFATGAGKCIITVKEAVKGSVSIRKGLLNSEDCGKLILDETSAAGLYEIDLSEKISGLNDVYFVYEGEGLTLDSFRFK